MEQSEALTVHQLSVFTDAQYEDITKRENYLLRNCSNR